MEDYLPCECFDSINYYFYISIAPKFIDKDMEIDIQKIPEGVLHQVIETEPTQFYILSADSTKYIISIDSENKDFELTLKGDTLLLIDSISSKKFIKSLIPYEGFWNKCTNCLDNITLLNKALSLRGYPSIQTILKEDSLSLDCNAWLGNRNMIYSRKTVKKCWVVKIFDGYLHIYKVSNHHRDPLDPILKKEIKRLKWITNGTERQPREEEYPIFVSPLGVSSPLRQVKSKASA
jgi:hypothetical protein